MDWFCERHAVSITPSTGVNTPSFSPDARETIKKHLMSYSDNCVYGFTFGVDAIKSIVLMCAVVDRRLTVDEAVKLGRLELEVQVSSQPIILVPMIR